MPQPNSAEDENLRCSMLVHDAVNVGDIVEVRDFRVEEINGIFFNFYWNGDKMMSNVFDDGVCVCVCLVSTLLRCYLCFAHIVDSLVVPPT